LMFGSMIRTAHTGFSDLPRMAEVARLSYEDLINDILDQALRRNRMRLR